MAREKRYRRVVEGVASGLRALADAAFPPRCPSCHGAVSAAGNFCTECFSRVRMIAAPLCDCCGIPFIVAIEKGALCPDCLMERPAYTKARAVMVYDAVSRPLISALKFADQWSGVQRYSAMMQGAGGQVLIGADMLVPVPLHWRRLAKRKFNQSALLAYGISRRSGLPCVPNLLKRIRATKPQMQLDHAERARNVRQAFEVNTKMKQQVINKIVVLVDDVVTTGATVNACAKALHRAGAKEVRVLSLARTTKD